jgi:CHAT domain-containing protein
VVRRPDGACVPLRLDALTSDVVAGSVHRIISAAPLGAFILSSALDQTRAVVGPVVTEPIGAVLEPDEPIVISAGGLVALLPLQASPVAGDRCLVERHPVRYAVTRGVGGWAERRAAGRRLDWSRAWSLSAPSPSRLPALPGAAEESHAFAENAQRLTGEEVTVASAVRALGRADVAHFACHAATASTDPLANHLLFAGDEPWFGDAIAATSTEARLVVLSACGSADTGRAHAEEGLGLAGAFHLAGVPGVVATLWSVPDRPSAHLMSAFASSLRSGLSPAEALRTAILREIPAGPLLAWAPFVLLGA